MREADAAGALFDLRRDFGLSDDQIAVSPVAVEGEPGTIVAFSSNAEGQAATAEVVLRHGGRIVADVPESWTRSSPLAR